MDGRTGGLTSLRRSNRDGEIPAGDRYIRMFQPTSFSQSSAQPLELSENDIFSIDCGDRMRSPARPSYDRKPERRSSPAMRRSDYGFSTVRKDDLGTGSARRGLSVSATLSSPPSSYLTIPRPLPPPRLFQQSAPVNVPVMPAEFLRRAREMADAVSEGEDDDGTSAAILPPHESVKHHPILSCSVAEGAGRSLKGIYLLQVRKAVGKKTGFMD